ncbi:T9SS type A sorting domain-containing protein [Marinilabilia rubra]|uniref:Secretion system C-terminal sorting domain-containing protein n=1 Tax=Marinilabilia rubra TaxID=2162893 RepID=A0A2U2B7Y5_9BACT|nr:T9SS type A sorting domain-containing protein [Marinilabilia rubra]PWD99162.1 hypothetical protein DDZ16_11225 [Marinilabilia rubra]
MRKTLFLLTFFLVFFCTESKAQDWTSNGDTLFREKPVIIGSNTGSENSILSLISKYDSPEGGGYGLINKHSSSLSYLQFRSRGRVGYSSAWYSQAQSAAFAGTNYLKTDHAGQLDSHSSGGLFVLEFDDYRPYSSYLSTTHYLGGSYSTIRGNILGYPNNFVISAVIGQDQIRNDSTFAGYFEGRGFFSDNVGFGTVKPTAKVEVADGDVYISDIDKGIIMKSPDGNCWKGILDNTGMLSFSPVQCPDAILPSSSPELKSSEGSVSLYPNPAGDDVSIEINDSRSTQMYYSIVNIDGKELEAGFIEGNKYTLDVGNFNSGVYLVNITDVNGDIISTKKLIKE